MTSTAAETRGYEDAGRSRSERIALVGFDYASQPKEDVTSCNLCGAESFTVIAHRDRYDYPAQAISCANCALTVLSPRMTAAAYGKFYDGVYRPLVSAFHGRRIDARTIQPEQKLYADQMAKFLRPYLGGREGATLLDVGGSTGIVAAELSRRFGLRGTVIDPSPAELLEAEAQGLETIAGFIENWEPGNRRFHVVGLFQTIDHLLDASSTLTKIRSVLHDDGLFVVDIVDFRAVYLKNWSIEMGIKIDHPYYFTEATAEAMFSRIGFSVVRKSYNGDHVAYVCKKAPPAQRLTSPTDVSGFFQEVRFVQSAPAAARSRLP